MLAAACTPGWAQDGLIVSSGINGSLVYSDIDRVSGARERDLSLQVQPTVQAVSRSGRVRGSLFYGLALTQHAQRSRASELQNSLTASFVAEALPNWLFVDGAASISQRALSPFGRQAVEGSAQESDNKVEVGTVSLSPYARGSFAGLLSYDLRANVAATNARHSLAGDSLNTGAALSLGSNRGTLFGASLSLTTQRTDFRVGRTTQTDRAIASVTAAPHPEVLLTLRGGEEATDAASADRRRYDNWGGTLDWRPTQRTTATFGYDRRYFGNARNILFEHRFPLTSVRFSSVRDASTSGDPTASARAVTLYDLLYFQATSAIPDPIQRDQAVRAAIAGQNRDPGEVVAGGFLNSSITVQRRDDLAWTYAGRRVTLTLQAAASETRQLDATAQQPANEPVRQRSYTAVASYRLTPTASASVNGSRLKTLGNASNAGTDLKSVGLTASDQIGLRTTASVGARYSVFNSAGDGYREASVNASVTHRF